MGLLQHLEVNDHTHIQETKVIESQDLLFLNNVIRANLTIRFLEASTGRSTSILLWFTSARITDQQVTIVIQQCLAQSTLGLFIDVLGVVRHNRLGNGLTDGINLSSDTSTLHSDADIEVAELVLSYNKDRFEDLQTKSGRFDQFNGLAIDFDQSAALLGESNCGSGLFSV